MRSGEKSLASAGRFEGGRNVQRSAIRIPVAGNGANEVDAIAGAYAGGARDGVPIAADGLGKDKIIVADRIDGQRDFAGGRSLDREVVADFESMVLHANLDKAGAGIIVFNDADIPFLAGGEIFVIIGKLVCSRATVEESEPESPVVDAGASFDEFVRQFLAPCTIADGIQSASVGTDDGCDIFGRAGAPFDFQGSGAGLQDLIQEGKRAKISCGKDGVGADGEFGSRSRTALVFVFANDGKRASAGLLAHSAVCRSPVCEVRQEATARFGDALGTMDKDLDFAA